MSTVTLTTEQIGQIRALTSDPEILSALDAAEPDDWGVFESATEFGENLILCASGFEWWTSVESIEGSEHLWQIVGEDPNADGFVSAEVSAIKVAQLHAAHVTRGSDFTETDGRVVNYGHLETGGDEIDSYDAISADVVLQMAVYGEVAFG